MLSRIRSPSYLRRAADWSLGENLAWGSGFYATPAETVKSWMASAGHRANILHGGFRDVGIGLALGCPMARDDGGATYVTEFGRRAR